MADNYPASLDTGADTFIGGQIIALALVLLTRRLGCTADQVKLEDLADVLDTPSGFGRLLETAATSKERDTYLRLDAHHHRGSDAWNPATLSAVQIVIVQMLTDAGLAKPGDRVWVDEEQGDLPTPWRGLVTSAFLHAPFGTATSPRARTSLTVRPETVPFEVIVDPRSATPDPVDGQEPRRAREDRLEPCSDDPPERPATPDERPPDP